MKRSPVIVGSLVASLLVGWLALRRSDSVAVPSRHPDVVPAVQTRVSAPEPRPAVEDPEAGVDRSLSQAEFKRRFHITLFEAEHIGLFPTSLRRELMERKSAGAQVTRFDGRILELFSPALFLSEEQQEAACLEQLCKALGEQRAMEIWADPVGRATLVSLGKDPKLVSDAIYTITRTAEERDPESIDQKDFATFNVDVKYRYRGRTPLLEPLQNETLIGFNYLHAGDAFLGWNALAKAPAGYFRSAPILGVASRSVGNGLSLRVTMNQETGEAEISGLRGPDSREVVKVDAPVATPPATP
jgi:hypothetical protein